MTTDATSVPLIWRNWMTEDLSQACDSSLHVSSSYSFFSPPVAVKVFMAGLKNGRCGVSFWRMLTFFLLGSNLCLYSSWHMECFSSFLRWLLVIHRKILFCFSDVKCFLFEYYVFLLCLTFLSLF